MSERPENPYNDATVRPIPEYELRTAWQEGFDAGKAEGRRELLEELRGKGIKCDMSCVEAPFQCVDDRTLGLCDPDKRQGHWCFIPEEQP